MFSLPRAGRPAAARSALALSQWKAASILAGSVIEAVLHWKLSQDAVACATAQIALGITTPFDRLGLDEHIKIAVHLNVLSQQTVDQAKIAKDYRNLIHAGRAIRLNMKSTRGSAHASIGGMDLVLEALG